MTVREDAIERPDGSRGIYGVVEKADFALVIPFDGEGFYLVEQYRYPVGARFREFPQGSWEAAPAADPLTVARGELQEETGLQAGSMEHLGYLYEAYGFSTQGFDVYLATELSQGTATPTIEEADLRVERVTVPEFKRLVRDGAIKDAPSVAAYSLLQLRRERL
jgi:8-oxo-dGTP pyrophosphatase MutT (NUDIX family)